MREVKSMSKTAAGLSIGSPSLKVKGQVDEATGKAQQKLGKVQAHVGK